MKNKKISHLGIAVKDLNESMKIYKALGLELENIEEVKSQKVKVAFFPVGESRIELLEPTTSDSPIQKFIDKKGEGLHHVAYAVENIEEALKSAKDNGFKLIDKEPRLGAHNAKIAFLHPKSTGRVLIELCEEAE